ncbi:MAG TPA: hypothetical protein VFC24_10200 [Casimicrobiaceae bacterium]|nr:hypothetical protein [Casimicrobiaceae bacterium]
MALQDPSPNLPQLNRPPGPPVEPHLAAHAVPWQHALTWFEDALRLFKRRPLVWVGLAVLTLATEFSLQLLPDPWPLLSNVVAPLVACGMLFAAAAADRHAPPRMGYAFTAFRAPTGAVVAIIVASLVTFLAEAFAAWWIADVNLFQAHAATEDLTASARIGVYAIGVLASLPIAFVPLHVLFEPVGLAEAFAASWNAFLLNTVPLLVYAGLSLVLLLFGLLTMGIGLALVMPLWAASSYTAWRDIFAIEEAPVV